MNAADPASLDQSVFPATLDVRAFTAGERLEIRLGRDPTGADGLLGAFFRSPLYIVALGEAAAFAGRFVGFGDIARLFGIALGIFLLWRGVSHGAMLAIDFRRRRYRIDSPGARRWGYGPPPLEVVTVEDGAVWLANLAVGPRLVCQIRSSISPGEAEAPLRRFVAALEAATARTT